MCTVTQCSDVMLCCALVVSAVAAAKEFGSVSCTVLLVEPTSRPEGRT